VYWGFWESQIDHAVGGEWGLKDVIGGLRTPIEYTFALNMATGMLAEMLGNLQNSMQLIPENRS
jgi:hypothetical protein